MKKLILMVLFAISTTVFAQTSYEQAMTSALGKISQTKAGDDFVALSNTFTRIGDKEKNQWLPYYYAAYSQILKGRQLMQQNQTQSLDAVADAAQKSLDQAMALNKESAENYILEKMIHGLRLMVNPQERYMTEGMLGSQALDQAKKLDPENPRITLQEAEDVYFMPPMVGGSKEEGLKLFQKALNQFKNYKVKSALDPNWGQEEAEYFLKTKP